MLKEALVLALQLLTEPRDTEFVCECEDWERCCVGLTFYGEHTNGKRYCILHYPSKDKNHTAFGQQVDKKLASADLDFRGVWFPYFVACAHMTFGAEVNLSYANFSEGVDFTKAGFNGPALFSETHFGGKSYESTYFVDATFGDTATFRHATFTGEKVDFSKASLRNEEPDFSSAEFVAETYFNNVTFNQGAKFTKAKFCGQMISFDLAEFAGRAVRFDKVDFTRGQEAGNHKVTYQGATFLELASFEGAQFSREVDFSRANFCEVATFHKASFKEKVSFSGATFHSAATFSAAEGSEGVYLFPVEPRDGFTFVQRVNLRGVKIKNPRLVTFERIVLRPSWFIGVAELQNLRFDSVTWYGIPKRWRAGKRINEEIEIVKASNQLPNLRLEEVCRQLADLAEKEDQPVRAAEFRYWAKEVRRRRNWTRYLPSLNWWYWAMSGYGERPLRAFLVLVLIWFLFAIVYACTGYPEPSGPGDVYAPSNFKQTFSEADTPIITKLWQAIWPALVWSLGAITRLIQGPTQPTVSAAGMFQFLVFLEGVLGPLQIALLLLAIRRRLQLEDGSS